MQSSDPFFRWRKKITDTLWSGDKQRGNHRYAAMSWDTCDLRANPSKSYEKAAADIDYCWCFSTTIHSWLMKHGAVM
jgi:hypothetical protein